MGSSVNRSKNIVSTRIQTKYFKDTIAHQEQELKESLSKIVSLENELALNRQELGQCQTELKLSKQEILYRLKKYHPSKKRLF
jgi:septal ring factor EnvC (AmiA/AmiB activator)